MKLVRSQIPEAGCEVVYTADPTSFDDLGDGVCRLEPVQVRARVDPERMGIRLHGRFSTVLWLQCGRCLTEFSLAVSAPFEVLLMPPKAANGAVQEGQEVQLAEADLVVTPLEGDRINVTEWVREQLLLEVPLVPLCKVDCSGLCATCGADLNTGPCECDAPVDPRFAVLAKLKRPPAGQE